MGQLHKSLSNVRFGKHSRILAECTLLIRYEVTAEDLRESRLLANSIKAAFKRKYCRIIKLLAVAAFKVLVKESNGLISGADDVVKKH